MSVHHKQLLQDYIPCQIDSRCPKNDDGLPVKADEISSKSANLSQNVTAALWNAPSSNAAGNLRTPQPTDELYSL